MTIKVLIHELAHATMHQNSTATFGNLIYQRQEFEAESVTYIVSQHLGMDTSDYSFGYLSSWTKQGNQLEELTTSLERITQEAQELIAQVDQTLNKVYVLDAPKNVFEERVAEAKRHTEPPKRTPKEVTKVPVTQETTTTPEQTKKRFGTTTN